MNLRGTFLLVVAAAGCAWARVDQWPEYLVVPEARERDTSRFDLSARQVLLENSFESSNSVTVRRDDSLRSLEQSFVYEFANDRGLGSRDQYLDLGGEYHLSGRRWRNTTIGLDWSPSFLLNTRRDGSGFLGAVDMGPTFGVEPLGIPLEMRVGVSGRKWSDELPRAISRDLIFMGSDDFGFYGGAEVGNGDGKVGSLPLYITGSVYARLIDTTSRLSAGKGQALYCQGLDAGDSLFLYLADSLSWGHEQVFGRGTYVQLTDRRANSLQVAGGYRFREGWRLVPGVVYAFSQYTEAYPTDNLLRDRRNRKNSLNVIGHADSLLPLAYSGGFKVLWESEDRLYAYDLSNRKAGGVGDSLYWTNLGDYQESSVGMTHELSRSWESGLGIRYLFDIFREKTEYPYWFESGSDTVRNSGDRFWVVQEHKGEISMPRFANLEFTLTGGYARNSSLYLKSSRSAGNSVTNTYTLGIAVDFLPSERLSVREVGEAEANVTGYSFPEFHRHPFDPPPYSRSFSSQTKVSWDVKPAVTITGELEGVYWDNGYWNGREYYDARDTGSNVDYYAITRKTLDWWLTLGCTFVAFDYLSVTVGNKFANVFYREWLSLERKYQENTLGIGQFYLEPFVGVRSLSEADLALEAHIKRAMHDPVGEMRGMRLPEARDDYWELSIVCSYYF